LEMANSMRYWMLAALLVMVVPGLAAADPTAEGSDRAAHSAEGLNLVDFSSETSQPLVALLANFVLLVIIVYLVLKNPLGRRFKERKASLEKALAEARETKALAEKSIAEARAQMAAIEEVLARVRSEILGAGKGESEKIAGEAESRAKRLRDDTEALVAHEVHRIAAAVKEEAVLRIVAMAERAIREKIGKEDHERLNDEYLNRIADDSASAQG
jgi:F-type H+-transporting ATPase subunit b